MSLAHCSYCGERNSAKYSQVTWAWNVADGSRSAYRQKLCPGCYAQLVLKLDRPVEPGAELSCPACGIVTEHDYDAVYATTFVPGFGKVTYEWPLCGVHAVAVRAEAMVNAERLEDRQSRGLEAAPSPDPSLDAWAALGIYPRE